MKLRLPFKPRLPALLWRPDAAFLIRALTAIALILLAWALSSLLITLLAWRSAEPALSLPAPPAEDSASGRRALLRWFAVPEKPTANPLASLQLIAVIAGRNGVALIGGIEAAPIAIKAGNEARAGLKLIEVKPDRAIFEQAGVPTELPFPASTQANAAGLINAAPPRPTPAATPGKPAEASQNAIVSRGRLASIAQSGNLGAWDKGLAAFANGGIRVTAAAEQPLAQVLNLHDGDIIKRVNERDIQQLADVSLVYHYFSQSQDVDLQILRDGKPLHLLFKIQP